MHYCTAVRTIDPPHIPSVLRSDFSAFSSIQTPRRSMGLCVSDRWLKLLIWLRGVVESCREGTGSCQFRICCQLSGAVTTGFWSGVQVHYSNFMRPQPLKSLVGTAWEWWPRVDVDRGFCDLSRHIFLVLILEDVVGSPTSCVLWYIYFYARARVRVCFLFAFHIFTALGRWDRKWAVTRTCVFRKRKKRWIVWLWSSALTRGWRLILWPI